MAGEVDAYAGKPLGLLAIPALALGIYGLLLVLPLIDPEKSNYPKFAAPYAVIRFALTLFLCLVQAAILSAALGGRVNMTTWMGLGLGGLFIALGTVMGRIRRSWFVGVRTPWTLTSELSWTKSHRLAGWLFVAMGLLAIAWAVMPDAWMFGLMIVFDVGCVVWIVIYSYLVYRSDPSRAASNGDMAR
jgi:uncharacterized membrane protein